MKVERITKTSNRFKPASAAKPSFKALEVALANNSPLKKLFIELGIKKVQISIDFTGNLNHIVIVRYLFLNSNNELLFERQIKKNFTELSFNKMFDTAEALIFEYKSRIQ